MKIQLQLQYNALLERAPQLGFGFDSEVGMAKIPDGLTQQLVSKLYVFWRMITPLSKEDSPNPLNPNLGGPMTRRFQLLNFI